MSEDRFALVPYGEKVDEPLERIIDTLSKSGVGLEAMLDADSTALSASDMKYFPKEYYGRVPSYGVFVKYLNKLPGDVRDNFNEVVAEIEAGRYTRRMEKLADNYDGDKFERSKFEMYNKLETLQERRLGRIDRRRKERGDGEARGIDLATRMIAALSSADLLKIKERVETIDAECQAVEVAVPNTGSEKPALLADAKEVKI